MARSTNAAADDRPTSSVTATAAAGAEEEEEQEEVAEIWGTWEDLLLACAVNRHGPHSWDSVAFDVLSRSTSPLSHLLTAADCRRRYRILSRRYSSSSQPDTASDDPSADIPWLDELRSLRVAELRREVQRYDASIGSLQLKVKRLKEEQQAVGNAANGSGCDPKEENNIVGSVPDTAAREDSGRSCKESNSTEPKLDDEVIKVEERIKEEADPAVNASRTTTSYNGSSDTRAVRSPVADPDPMVNESGESVAESKGGEEDEEGAKDNSDVQSSAGLSMRRRRRGRRRVAAGGEVEAEAVSPVHTMVDVESQPLIVFLETVRSSNTGSVFDHRLESQENVRYRSLIRRHVDLEIVRNRIGSKGYTSAEFFRDLLLLCNNALVFYPKNSPESISAVHLRDLINKEIAANLRKTPQTSPLSAKEPTPPPAQQSLLLPPLKPKSDAGLLEKPATLPPLVACRKRSSISKLTKPVKKIEKEEVEEVEVEEEEEEEEEDDEKVVVKKSMKPKLRGLRTNKTRAKSRGGAAVVDSKSSNSNLVSATKPELVSVEQELKSGGGAGGSSTSLTAKKKSAADFLNRMKSSSPSSSNGKGIETANGSNPRRGGGGDQQKKKSKEDMKKERLAATKKNVGRPPKRGEVVPAVSGKRAREEKVAPPVAKKRGRR